MNVLGGRFLNFYICIFSRARLFIFQKVVLNILNNVAYPWLFSIAFIAI